MGVNRNSLGTIILAAGKGTRMKSRLSKVLHPICGTPMLQFSIDLAKSLNARPIVIVIGHQAERLREVFSTEESVFVEQKEQLGTGHAVACAAESVSDHVENVLILCGDVPLLCLETVKELVDHHEEAGATLTILSGFLEDPTNYGRLLRNQKGEVIGIVEEKDANPQQRSIQEINTGIYCVKKNFLFEAIHNLKRDNVQGEYYLTDVLDLAEPGTIATVQAKDSSEFMGINTRIDLAKANDICRIRTIEHLMLEGVTFVDPSTVYIDRMVTIGRDSVIYPNCFLEWQTIIGEACTIEPGSRIVDSKIGDEVHIRLSSMITESKVDKGAEVGPFAHLRPQSEIGEDVRIGNFVEVKKSKIERGSKASHLTYIGDASVGKDVNIGCGTITCNYDGKQKHQTIIEDEVFVGSDTQFVAPVRIGAQAIIGAGSTITKNVPPNALAVSRAKQVNYRRMGKKRYQKKA
jgi:bifunctional UDP-N-acetylglucosamine pyrophosphorylase/glucosamine-1-phosphate N-acetyltransferase